MHDSENAAKEQERAEACRWHVGQLRALGKERRHRAQGVPDSLEQTLRVVLKVAAPRVAVRVQSRGRGQPAGRRRRGKPAGCGQRGKPTGCGHDCQLDANEHELPKLDSLLGEEYNRIRLKNRQVYTRLRRP